MGLKLLEFINNNKDWEELLVKKPYCLKIKRNNEYIMFSYSQIESDFNNDIVRECRGIILYEDTMLPVCIPFFKFGNYGESYCPEIDWCSANTQEKVDGSLIKLWYHNEKWNVSTNGTIDAYICEIGQSDLIKIDCPYRSFGELFDKAKTNINLDFENLNKNYTYMFELVSPYNKIVVPYKDIEIYHIGTRDNNTFQELNVDIGVKKTIKYKLGTLEDCINSASKLPYSNEGYVVVDKNWNRIKIKSPQYVAVHHIKNNGDINISSIVQLIRANELDEFLTYFPEFNNAVNIIKNKIENFIFNLENGLNEVKDKTYDSQKDFAIDVVNRKFSAFYFSWRKDNNLKPKDWFWSMDNNKIKELVK